MPPAADSIERFTHRDVHRMMERLQGAVLTIRQRLGPLPVVLLADRVPELRSLFSQHFNSNALGFGRSSSDAWHALEYLAAAVHSYP
jgi:hypothetical protein